MTTAPPEAPSLPALLRDTLTHDEAMTVVIHLAETAVRRRHPVHIDECAFMLVTGTLPDMACTRCFREARERRAGCGEIRQTLNHLTGLCMLHLIRKETAEPTPVLVARIPSSRWSA